MAYGYGDYYDVGVDYLLGQQAQIQQDIADAQAVSSVAVAGGSATQIVGFDSGGTPIPINVTGDSNGVGLSVSGGVLTATLTQDLQTTASPTFAKASAGRFVEAKTADYPITTAQKRYVFTNEGAAAQVVFTLPAAVAGYEFLFYVQESQNLRIQAAAGDKIYLAAIATVGGGYAENATVGSSIQLIAVNATDWVTFASQGTWTLV